MAKRILVVPDVHGRIFWKKPVAEYLDGVDKIVFLGDYFDPYLAEDGLADNLFQNMEEILQLKRENPGKVVLLKGNHDQHYSSALFKELGRGSRMDKQNWQKYHDLFQENGSLFQLAYLEEVNGTPYVFTHAGVTQYWLHKVNTKLWQLPDDQVSLADPDIIARINRLDDGGEGQKLLAVVGRSRSWFGEETGSMLWADIDEHALPDAPESYGLSRVFQVFGHTKLQEGYEMIASENLAMIDSRQCFMIDENLKDKIHSIK